MEVDFFAEIVIYMRSSKQLLDRDPVGSQSSPNNNKGRVLCATEPFHWEPIRCLQHGCSKVLESSPSFVTPGVCPRVAEYLNECSTGFKRHGSILAPDLL